MKDYQLLSNKKRKAQAMVMCLGEYNQLRNISKEQFSKKEGFFVKYLCGDILWIAKEVFIKRYVLD